MIRVPLHTIIVIVSMAAHAVAAQEATGFVSGVVLVPDSRASWRTGSEIPPTKPAMVPAREALIQVTPLITPFVVNDDGLLEEDARPSFAKTDPNGVFFVKWEDPNVTSADFDIFLAVDVIWASPDMQESIDLPIDTIIHDAPDRRFTIRPDLLSGERDVDLVERQIVEAKPFSPTDHAALNFFLPYQVPFASDASNAYITAEDYFFRVIDGGNGALSPLLAARMKNVDIFINLPFPPQFEAGISPDDHSSHIYGATATTGPFVEAHELSHVVTWNALGLESAPIQLQQFCKNGTLLDLTQCTWGATTNENQRVAFLEGIADAFASVWLWDLTAPGEKRLPRPVARGGFTTRSSFDNEEVIFVDGTSADPAYNIDGEAFCETGFDNVNHVPFKQFEVPMCQAAAMWDLMDAPVPVLATDPPDDDPSVDITQADVFQTFDEYPDNCSIFDPLGTERCSNEGGDDGLNHNDFAFHFVRPGGAFSQSRSDNISAIFTLNQIAGGEQ